MLPTEEFFHRGPVCDIRRTRGGDPLLPDAICRLQGVQTACVVERDRVLDNAYVLGVLEDTACSSCVDRSGQILLSGGP